jgi:hypothetical protein
VGLEDRCTLSIAPVLPEFGISPVSSGVGNPVVALAGDEHHVSAREQVLSAKSVSGLSAGRRLWG